MQKSNELFFLWLEDIGAALATVAFIAGAWVFLMGLSSLMGA